MPEQFGNNISSRNVKIELFVVYSYNIFYIVIEDIWYLWKVGYAMYVTIGNVNCTKYQKVGHVILTASCNQTFIKFGNVIPQTAYYAVSNNVAME